MKKTKKSQWTQSSPFCACLQMCVCVALICATSVKQHFHSQNSIFLSVWILFCWGDIALWWSHRSQGRYVIWIILAALWGLCLAAGWVKPSVPSQAWINQAAADEKWGRGKIGADRYLLQCSQIFPPWCLTWRHIEGMQTLPPPSSSVIRKLLSVFSTCSVPLSVTGKTKRSHETLCTPQK